MEGPFEGRSITITANSKSLVIQQDQTGGGDDGNDNNMMDIDQVSVSVFALMADDKNLHDISDLEKEIKTDLGKAKTLLATKKVLDAQNITEVWIRLLPNPNQRDYSRGTQMTTNIYYKVNGETNNKELKFSEFQSILASSDDEKNLFTQVARTDQFNITIPSEKNYQPVLTTLREVSAVEDADNGENDDDKQTLNACKGALPDYDRYFIDDDDNGQEIYYQISNREIYKINSTVGNHFLYFARLKKFDGTKFHFSVYGLRTNGEANVALVKVSGGGGSGFGATRSDPPGEYRWWGDEKVGVALGLDVKWRVNVLDQEKTTATTKKQKGTGDTDSEVITETYQDNGNVFFKTNTPRKLSFIKTSVEQGINPESEISYYKLMDDIPRTGYSKGPDSPSNPRIPKGTIQAKLFKQSGNISANDIGQSSNPLKPSDLFEIKLSANGVSSPEKFSSRLKDGGGPGGIASFAKKAKNFAVLSNPNKRVDTATVIYNAVKQDFQSNVKAFPPNDIGNKFPATKYVEYILTMDNALENQWKALSHNNSGPDISSGNNNNNNNNNQKAIVSTGQEWCHLYGHGIGGGDTYVNFVSGSHYCNTEQLAIEMAVRAGWHSGLSVSITAYRLRDTEIALWLRYRIYYRGKDNQTHKIFDHIFDGQSESFDYNEYKILETTVRRVVAEAIKMYGGDGEPLNQYQEKIQKKYEAIIEKSNDN